MPQAGSAAQWRSAGMQLKRRVVNAQLGHLFDTTIGGQRFAVDHPTTQKPAN
jgi:hypothetical protein